MKGEGEGPKTPPAAWQPPPPKDQPEPSQEQSVVRIMYTPGGTTHEAGPSPGWADLASGIVNRCISANHYSATTNEVIEATTNDETVCGKPD